MHSGRSHDSRKQQSCVCCLEGCGLYEGGKVPTGEHWFLQTLDCCQQDWRGIHGKKSCGHHTHKHPGDGTSKKEGERGGVAGRHSAVTANHSVLVQISLWSFSGKFQTESNKHTEQTWGCLPARSKEQQKPNKGCQTLRGVLLRVKEQTEGLMRKTSEMSEGNIIHITL